jgi:hypothetical protein
VETDPTRTERFDRLFADAVAAETLLVAWGRLDDVPAG